MKKYTLDMKDFLKQANWQHPDFGKVANFFEGRLWFVSEDMLEEITEESDDKN